MVSSLTRKLPTVIGALLLVATLFTAYTATQATAHHQPADKVAAAGSRVQKMGPGEAVPLLQESMKLSTPTDLLLSLTAECSILTQLVTSAMNDVESDTSTVRGQVRAWIEIDGTPVPVSGTDDGKVVFCDRMHEQQITNDPPQDDDTFTLRDYQLTRTANAFNWIALNPTSYDENGDNILDIVVLADFDLTVGGESVEPPAGICPAPNPDNPGAATGDCVQAFVGARTLIAEPTKLTGHEQVTETDAGGL